MASMMHDGVDHNRRGKGTSDGGEGRRHHKTQCKQERREVRTDGDFPGHQVHGKRSNRQQLLPTEASTPSSLAPGPWPMTPPVRQSCPLLAFCPSASPMSR